MTKKKNSKRSKYQPFEDQINLQTHQKRNEEVIANNDEYGKNYLEKKQSQDKSECKESLEEGVKEHIHEESKTAGSSKKKKKNKKDNNGELDQQRNNNKDSEIQAHSENVEYKTLEMAHKVDGKNESGNSLDHKTEVQNEKMECSSSEYTHKGGEKFHEESSTIISFSKKHKNNNNGELPQQLLVYKEDEKINNSSVDKKKNRNIALNKQSNNSLDHESEIQNEKIERNLHEQAHRPYKKGQQGNTYGNQKDCYKKVSGNMRSHDLKPKIYDQKRNKMPKSKENQNEPCITFDKSETCVLEEIDEDLFSLPKEFSLAHCVAEDLRMGAGIAVAFKSYFGGVGKLIDQKLRVGDVGIVTRHEQNAFYLVTKRISSGKPTLQSMNEALKSLARKMEELNVTKLGIPTIGCGLDGLDWSAVKSLIMEIFAKSGVHITVCVPSKILEKKSPPPLKVYITPKNLWEMECQTDMIIFIDLEQVHKQNWTCDIIDKVNIRYPFKEKLLKDIKNKTLNPGEITYYCVQTEMIFCVFTNQNAYYSSLENGFIKIHKLMKNYRYLAIQSGPIESYPTDKHITWLLLILRSFINNKQCELWLCGGTEQDEPLSYDEYYRNKRFSTNYSFKYNSFNQTDKKDYSSPSYTTREKSYQN